MSSAAYLQLCQRSREIYLLRSVAGVLSWDFETYLPSKAVLFRADQLSYLESKAHTLLTESSVGDWLKAAEQFGFEPGSLEEGNIREWRRSYDRATKIPVALVEEFEKTRTIAREAWVQARAASKFSLFEPHLQKIIDLTRQKADLWGYQDSPYDALIDDYEPGITASQVKPVLEQLRIALVDLLGEIPDKSVQEDFLNGHYPIDGQQAFSREVAAS